MNLITVNFVPCATLPSKGYRVKWRVYGSFDQYTDAGNFFTSPAVFTDSDNPPGTEYEGTITPEGNNTDCDPVFWNTVQDGSSDQSSGESGEVFAIPVRANDGTAGLCGQIPYTFYSLSEHLEIGAFIYFDAGLTMPVDVYFYCVEGGQDEPGIIYECSTSGEIVANSGLSCT